MTKEPILWKPSHGPGGARLPENGFIDEILRLLKNKYDKKSEVPPGGVEGGASVAKRTTL